MLIDLIELKILKQFISCLKYSNVLLLFIVCLLQCLTCQGKEGTGIFGNTIISKYFHEYCLLHGYILMSNTD